MTHLTLQSILDDFYNEASKDLRLNYDGARRLATLEIKAEII